MKAFHAYDIRGVYNHDFNKDDVFKVGYFLPKLLNTQLVLVGRDARESSPEIYEYLIEGITTAGADVHYVGLATTPMVYFASFQANYKASVQITASHNPREYNGLKISREDARPVGYSTGLAQIEEWMKTQEIVPAPNKGKVSEISYKDAYLQFLAKYKSDFSNLKIAVDLSNGMGALIVRDVLGNSPIYIFDELDGTFPNHEANPLDQKNLIELKKQVKQNTCDVGLIFDGDADRVVFVDENGEFVSPDLIIALIGEYYHSKGMTNLVGLQDIRSSLAISEYLAPLGAKMHTWKVGRAFAAEKLREIDGLFGGELAGHYYFKEFSYSDSAMLAALIVLNIVSNYKKQGVSVSSLISKISKYKTSGEVNFKLSRKRDAMEAVREYFTTRYSPKAFYDFDGYRLEFENWWFNIRMSNTEPYLRLIVEATSQDEMEEKLMILKGIITSFND